MRFCYLLSSHVYFQHIKNLRDDDAIIILPADKGRATVILNKEDYIRKCNDRIDNGPYQYLKKDLTESIKRETRQKLQRLLDREYYR